MIDQLVTARMSRQAIWDRKDPEPPVLSVILAESVLRQRVGDAQVMQEQLGRLVGTAENPRITTQIMPSFANARTRACSARLWWPVSRTILTLPTWTMRSTGR